MAYTAHFVQPGMEGTPPTDTPDTTRQRRRALWYSLSFLLQAAVRTFVTAAFAGRRCGACQRIHPPWFLRARGCNGAG